MTAGDRVRIVTWAASCFRGMTGKLVSESKDGRLLVHIDDYVDVLFFPSEVVPEAAGEVE